jgi:hypothetical protein
MLEDRRLLSTNVLNYHNDLARTGQNLTETTLNPGNVQVATFGKLASYKVDGQVYTQPLYYAGLTMSDGTVHDVIFVGTEHDSVYAIDANDGSLLWQTPFTDPDNGITSVPSGDLGSSDISPEVGITGTPVIDDTTNLLYVVARTEEMRSDGAHYVQKIHALDITSGAEPLGPTTIGDTMNDNDNVSEVSAPGTGDGSINGVITFNARKENERPGLVIVNGVVYASFASPGDKFPYHGWLLGYDTTTLQLAQQFITTPNGGAGGIWMSGGAPAVDGDGNIFVDTGNGTFSAGQSALNVVGINGGGLGYQGITNSAAITFRSYDHSSSGLGLNGQFLAPNDLTGTGIDFNAAAQSDPPHTFQATLTYDQASTTLTETITDLTTNATKTLTYTVDLAAQVGGGTAYVGFTGATGGLNATQDVQTWTFDNNGVHTIDHSAGFASHDDLTNNGSATYSGTAARLTAAVNNQAGSLFANTPVDITNFSTTFTFQMVKGTNPIADGITFTIQNYPVGSDYGESALKFSTAAGGLDLVDYFTPFNWQALNNGDTDFGSSGPMLLPDQPGDHPHIMVAAGKEGKLYVLDRDNLGQYHNGFDQVIQVLPGVIHGAYDTPAYFDSGTPDGRWVYYGAQSDNLKAFQVSNGMLSTSPTSKTTLAFGYPGVTPSISADGTNNGIVWVIEKASTAILRAYDALDLGKELYDSNQAGDRDKLGGGIKFQVPTIADGKVFVGTDDSVTIFGLLSGSTTAAVRMGIHAPAAALATTFAGLPSVATAPGTGELQTPASEPTAQSFGLDWTVNLSSDAATGIENIESRKGLNASPVAPDAEVLAHRFSLFATEPFDQ